jgi:hypothetical protein
MQQLILQLIQHGSSMDHAWIMHELCMDHAWIMDQHGSWISMDHRSAWISMDLQLIQHGVFESSSTTLIC